MENLLHKGSDGLDITKNLSFPVLPLAKIKGRVAGRCPTAEGGFGGPARRGHALVCRPGRLVGGSGA